MDDVRNWLKGIRLDEYANKFNEQGWDDISVVKTMSTDDIKTCVSKPGHVKKIEIAIQHLNKENHQEVCQNPSETDTNVPGAQPCTGRGEPDLSRVFEDEAFSCQSDTQSRERTCHEFTAANSNLENSRTQIANITQLDIKHPHISQPDIQQNIQPYLQPETTPPDIQPYIEPNIQPDITQPEIQRDITQTDIIQLGAVTVRNVNSQSEDEATSSEDDCNDTRRTCISPKSLIVARGRQLIAAEASMTIASSTIVKDSKNITIAKKVEVHNIHQRDSRYDNFTAQIQAAVDNYQKKKNLFGKTRAYQEVVHVLEDRYWAVVVGNPGDGKSTLANHLMCEHIDNEYDPVIVTSAEDWKTIVEGKGKESHKQFVIIDNMFGVMSTDERKLNEWMSLLDVMEKVVYERKGDLKVICTTRKHIWSEVSNRVSRFKVFGKLSVVDFTRHPLSNDEKIDILNRYYTYYKLEKDHVLLFLIKELQETSHGFPHCVDIFFTNPIIREKGILFFENPLEFVEREMEIFLSEDRTKMCALIFTLLSEENTFEIDVLHSDETQTSIEYKQSLSLSGLPVHTETSVIADAVRHLNTVYLREISDRVFTFKHDSFKEILSIVLSKRYPTRMIELLDIQFIVENVKCYGYKPSIEETVVVLPNSSSVVNALIYRITKEIINGNTYQICKHQAWDDERFISQWLSNVGTEKSQMGIEETLLIECLSASSSVELALNSGLLPMLACTQKEKVVSSFVMCSHLSKYWQTEKGNIQLSIALVYACYSDFSTNVLNMLLEHGAYIETTLTFGKYFEKYYYQTKTFSFVYTNIIDMIADRYCSPLTCSVFRGNVANTQVLLDNGASVFRLSSQCKSIVFLAAEGCSSDVLRCLLNHIDSLESKPIPYTYERKECPTIGHLYGEKHVPFLCDFRANIDPFHSRTPFYGNTFASALCPIHITDSAEIMDILYSRGASTNANVEIEENALPDIIYRGFINKLTPNTISTMVKYGTLVNATYANENVLHSLLHFQTNIPLELTESLIQQGLDVNQPDRLGRTPLTTILLGMRNGDNQRLLAKTSNILISNGADVNRCDEDGCVPLFYAFEYMAEFHTLTKLIELTDVRHVLSKDGKNCFHFLAKRSVSPYLYASVQDCVVQLLKKGADMNCTDRNGCCPLSIATVGMMDILIKNGAQTTILDKAGRNCVMNMLCNGIGDICNKINIFLTNGVDILETDQEKRNVMHYLATAGYDDSVKADVLEMFLSTNLKINAGDKHQITPLMLALESRNNDKAFISRLIEKGSCITSVDDCTHSVFWYLFRSTAKEIAIVELHEMLCSYFANNRDEIPEKQGMKKQLTVVKVTECAEIVRHILKSNRNDISKNVLLNAILCNTICKDVIEQINQDTDLPMFLMRLPICIGTLAKHGLCFRSMFLNKVNMQNLPETDDEIVTVVELLMKYGIDIADKLVTSQGYSPVLHFAKEGKLKTILRLLELGYDCKDTYSHQDSEDSNILHALLYGAQGDENVWLILGKIPIHLYTQTVNKDGVTPLLLACQQWRLRPKCISLMIRHGADVNFTDLDGLSAIHHLVKQAKDYNINDVLNLSMDLLDNNARLDIQDNEDRTPLMHMFMSQHVEKFEELINICIFNTDKLDQQDIYGWTALHYCEKSCLDDEKRCKYVQELLRRGLPPEEICELGSIVMVNEDEILSNTIFDKNQLLKCLFHRISTNQIQTVDTFICLLSDENINLNTDKDVTGGTLLSQSCRNAHDEYVELLLDFEADPNVPDIKGYTALHTLMFSKQLSGLIFLKVACFNESIQSEIRFQENDAVPCESACENVGLYLQELYSKSAFFPFILRILNKCIKILHLLLKHHADPNQMDIFGKSPLHYCVESPVIDGFTCLAMEMLIAHGADVNLEDNEGRTPIMLCVQHERTKYRRMNILIKAGAKFDAVDYSGKSVFDYTKIGIGKMINNL